MPVDRTLAHSLGASVRQSVLVAVQEARSPGSMTGACSGTSCGYGSVLAVQSAAHACARRLYRVRLDPGARVDGAPLVRDSLRGLERVVSQRPVGPLIECSSPRSPSYQISVRMVSAGAVRSPVARSTRCQSAGYVSSVTTCRTGSSPTAASARSKKLGFELCQGGEQGDEDEDRGDRRRLRAAAAAAEPFASGSSPRHRRWQVAVGRLQQIEKFGVADGHGSIPLSVRSARSSRSARTNRILAAASLRPSSSPIWAKVRPRRSLRTTTARWPAGSRSRCFTEVGGEARPVLGRSACRQEADEPTLTASAPGLVCKAPLGDRVEPRERGRAAFGPRPADPRQRLRTHPARAPRRGRDRAAAGSSTGRHGRNGGETRLRRLRSHSSFSFGATKGNARYQATAACAAASYTGSRPNSSSSAERRSLPLRCSRGSGHASPSTAYGLDLGGRPHGPARRRARGETEASREQRRLGDGADEPSAARILISGQSPASERRHGSVRRQAISEQAVRSKGSSLYAPGHVRPLARSRRSGDRTTIHELLDRELAERRPSPPAEKDREARSRAAA